LVLRYAILAELPQTSKKNKNCVLCTAKKEPEKTLGQSVE